MPEISINDYTVGQTLDYEVPTVANKELNIDKAKSWSYQLDDIDEVATDLPLMNKFTEDAGYRLKIAIDTECFSYITGEADSSNRGSTAGAVSGNIDLGTTFSSANGDNALSVTKTNATDLIVDFNTVLDEANIPSENRWVVIPAWFAGLLKKSDLRSADIQ